jgi:hypothetical protein
MVIANCQTFERIGTAAGSDLYRARRLAGGRPVLLKLARERADAAHPLVLSANVCCYNR